MTMHTALTVETIVDTLLLITDVVAELAPDHTIINVWTKHQKGVNQPDIHFAETISGVPLSDIVTAGMLQIKESFQTRKKSNFVYILPGEQKAVFWVNITAHKQFHELLLLAIEEIPAIDGDTINNAQVTSIIAQKTFDDHRNFYKQVLNHIAADIVIFDNNYKYLYLNPTAIKDPELRKWLIGKTDEDYCRLRNKPLTIAERRRSIIDKARDEQRPIEWEEKLINQQGEAEYHLRNLFPVFDDLGQLEYCIGYGLNITDRIIARNALQTSIETFSSAFDYSGIGMALVGPEGRWLDVNKVLCDLTGYSKEELLSLSFQDITYPDDLEIDVELVKKILRKEISTYSLEKRYISKSGKIVLVSLTVSSVWNTDGTFRFFIAQVVDITQKKELETALMRKNTALEAAKDNLINKIGQLEELSHIIAHNLRGPAGNIKVVSEALLAKTKGGENAEANALSDIFTQEEGLELIHGASESLINSLSSLMEIAEIGLNKDVPYSDCNVKEIIDEIVNQLHSTIYEKHAEIKQHIEVSNISYPKAYLENIFYNLISNALKYCRPDVAPEIVITTRLQTNKTQIVVKDNGLGIDLKRYGNKIFKLNQVFHSGFDSKGVGLYLTRTQVESFGGSIEVTSNLNEGCEFIVTL